MKQIQKYFSFARFLNENYVFYDNRVDGDVYVKNDVKNPNLVTEMQIYNEWKDSLKTNQL